MAQQWHQPTVTEVSAVESAQGGSGSIGDQAGQQALSSVV